MADTSADKIVGKCNALAEMLLEKNAAYGDSALSPLAVFAKNLTPAERMGVRMDDKISRLMRGSEYPGDDTLWDLAGYLILLLISRDDEVEAKDGTTTRLREEWTA